jgi:methyl-accepting chemotaxis protein
MQLKLVVKQAFLGLVMALILVSPMRACAESGLKGFELKVFNLATQCREETISRFELFLKSGKLTVGQLFDTFYIPIPNTYPQKYHTQYDKILDTNMQSLLDGYLNKSSRFIYFIVTDVNGYVPTHNSKFSQALTGNKEVDAKKNRTKLIFNDRTGLAAARNTAQYLFQEYPRDTGEMIYDLSVPIYVRGQHWGSVRVGYSK